MKKSIALTKVGKSRAPLLVLCAAALLALVSVGGPDAQAESEMVSEGGPPTLRRLNEDQYKRSIAQIFGPEITVGGRFEPAVREDGLLAIGDSKVVVTPSGFEQFALRARDISAQVLADGHREKYLTCAAATPAAFDENCAREFVNKYGRLLFRRPLDAKETAAELTLARSVTKSSGSFNKGLEAALARLLVSPNFVFRIDRVEPDPSRGGGQRIDAYSLATRISFLLWDAPPDAELLDAAASGKLRTGNGLESQVDRMMKSPLFEHGVRAFFADMFAFDLFDGLSKDPEIYPIFNPQLLRDAEEQTLRTIVDHLVTRGGDYRDLFTTKNTFLTRSLGAVYGVPVDYRGFGGWMPYTFPSDSPHAGILTLPAFLMLDASHEGRSSPTIRGKTVRENFLCQQVPLPPADVNFSIVQDVNDPVHKTARERLVAHQDNPVCAGCHRITDPIGLSLENYDPVGRYRTRENGVEIDASGEFEGGTYQNAIELMDLLRESPSAPACVVQRAFEYGVGRRPSNSEEAWLEFLSGRFAIDNYNFPNLLRQIATSPAFEAVSSESLSADGGHTS